jgi:flagellin
LADDINDIAASTTFNGLALLDGDSNKSNSLDLTFQVGEGTGDTFTTELEAVNVKVLFTGQTVTTADASLGAVTGTVDGVVAINNDGADPSGDVSDTANETGLNAGDTDDKGDSIYLEGDDETTGGEGKRGVLLIDTESASATSTGPANHNDYRNFLQHIDSALQKMNSNMNNIGIDQRSLSGKEVNLTEAITANSAAKSRIMDTDFAKEQSNSIRLQILQQTATAALSQANMGPQAVLGFLG